MEKKKKKAAILNHHSTLPSIFINTSVITSAIVVQTLVNVYNIKKNIEANLTIFKLMGNFCGQEK